MSNVITIPGGFDPEHGYCAQVVLLRDYEKIEDQRDQLRETLALWQQAFDDLFAQCGSNGAKNAWGKPIRHTLLNEANELTRRVLKEIA